MSISTLPGRLYIGISSSRDILPKSLPKIPIRSSFASDGHGKRNEYKNVGERGHDGESRPGSRSLSGGEVVSRGDECEEIEDLTTLMASMAARYGGVAYGAYRMETVQGHGRQ